MKKILSCLLLCAMLFSALSVGIFAEENGITADTSWYDETKTEFTLTTAAQLAGLDVLMKKDTSVEKEFRFIGKTVLLGADIDLSGYKWNGSGLFDGTFNGQGHTVSNLNSPDGRAMFGYAVGIIQNFTLIDPVIGKSATNCVGAIVGDRNQSILKDKSLTISDVRVVDATIAGGTCVGGILGNTNDGSATGNETVTVKNCSFSGTVNGVSNVGGVVGYLINVNQVSIKNCTVSGTVSGTQKGVGGIIGCTKSNFDIENCTVKGIVSATDDACGGLVGWIYNEKITAEEGMTASLNNCHANVSITGSGNRKGGLIGRVNISSSKLDLSIKNCLAEGKITLGSNQTFMAGLVAWLHVGGTPDLNASFENTISGMDCVSNEDGSALPNFKGIANINDNITTVSLKLTNVYVDSEKLGNRGLVKNDQYVVSDSVYGAKTNSELQALDLTGWTMQLYDYPIPSALIEGKTYLIGEQTKANADGTTDYRLVAVWNMAQGDRLENYTDIGFIATLTDDKTGETLYQNQKVSCKSVYTAVTGTNAQGETLTYTPDQWGGDYLFVLVLEGVDADAQFTLRLTPYTTDTNGNDSLGLEFVKKND